MKIKLLAAAAVTLVAGSAMAQSAFQGAYGQIGTGYENNSLSNLSVTGTDIPANGTSDNWSAGNQSFGSAPLVLGVGYNFSLAPKWLLGIGADYSALSQKSSSFSSTRTSDGTSASLSGSTVEMSNRFNIFVTPGYAIDKDKLAYFKAGYSMVTQKVNSPSGYSNSDGDSSALSSGSQSKNLSGYILGVGYKQIIAGGIYGFAEFNYMSYSKQTYSGPVASDYSASVSPSTSSYQGLIGVGYKF